MSFDQLNRVSYKTKKVLPRFLKVKLFSFYCRSLTYFQPSGITGAGGRLCRKCSPFPLSYSESDTAGNGIPSDMQDRCCEPPHLLSCNPHLLLTNPAPAASCSPLIKVVLRVFLTGLSPFPPSAVCIAQTAGIIISEIPIKHMYFFQLFVFITNVLIK